MSFFLLFSFRETLPQLYNETQKRKELIREVEMGPFKHEVDDGLDLRKAAFECMYTLLDTCIDRLDIFEFLTHVQDGLKDHYDIKVNENKIRYYQRVIVVILDSKQRIFANKENFGKENFGKENSLQRKGCKEKY